MRLTCSYLSLPCIANANSLDQNKHVSLNLWPGQVTPRQENISNGFWDDSQGFDYCTT